MDIKNLFDFINQADDGTIGQTEETTIKKTTFSEGIENGFIGGMRIHESTDPHGKIEIVEEECLVLTCIGHLVTTNSDDARYPHYAGKCFKGHPTCNLHLNKCDEPGCEKLICPRDGAEYKTDQFKCLKHYRIWKVCQVLKFIFSPFVKFQE